MEAAINLLRQAIEANEDEEKYQGCSGCSVHNLKVNRRLLRRERSESSEPVGSWLRTIKKRLNDSTMPKSMKSRARTIKKG